ncbi:hypothetical protein [Acidisoma cladoniae]|nr:hypothetical protein [Acidisoma sp. PAMC 29798]
MSKSLERLQAVLAEVDLVGFKASSDISQIKIGDPKLGAVKPPPAGN